MIEADVNNLIDNFKAANKSLRKRSITIGILTILTIGLVYMESARFSTVKDLLNYESKLDKINELPDTTFRKVVNGDDDIYFPISNYCNSCFERSTLFKKIKANNYDKRIIVDAISDIDTRIDKVNEEKAVSILNFTIPIKPMYYIFFFIMLVLFHDFTQTLIYRNLSYKRIKGLNIPSWKLGFELFGFYNMSNHPSLKFTRVTSTILSSIFVLCPFVTSIMMLNLSKNSSRYDEILLPLNIICLVFIIIDTLIIFYTENIWGFKTLSKLFLGNHRTNIKELQKIWLGPILFASIVFISKSSNFNSSLGFKIIYCFFCLGPLACLYFVLVKCHNTPSRLWRGLRTGLLVINSCWLFFSLFQTITPERVYTYRDFEYVLFTLFIFAIIAAISSFIYARFFIIERPLRKQ